MTWAIRLAKMGVIAAALLTFGWLAAVVVGAAVLLWLLLASEPDLVG